MTNHRQTTATKNEQHNNIGIWHTQMHCSVSNGHSEFVCSAFSMLFCLRSVSRKRYKSIIVHAKVIEKKELSKQNEESNVH